MRVPDRAGRIAWLAFTTIAAASFYWLDAAPKGLQSFGNKVALAGAAVCIALLHTYRSSLRECAEIPILELTSLLQSKRRFLKVLSFSVSIVTALLFLYYALGLNYHWSVLGINPLYAGFVALVVLALREVINSSLASSKFIRN